MTASPEFFYLPRLASKFTKAGLTREIIYDLLKGTKKRDLIFDARRLLPEFLKDVSLKIAGEENIQDSGLIVFNHPSNRIIFPAFLSLLVKINEKTDKHLSLVMASEIMLSAHLNKKVPLPGSIAFMRRFHSLYKEEIIPTPTAESRKDHYSGRALALRKIIKQLQKRQIIALAPEGHIEIDNQISPLEAFHNGSGMIAKFTSKIGLPIVPIGIWGKTNVVYVNIGKPVKIFSEDNFEATCELMKHIADNLPEELRGPFKDKP
jgi:hypothetical protein